MSIEVNPKTALVGFDKNEKQAFVPLLARFLDPFQGEIRFDGKNLRWLMDGKPFAKGSTALWLPWPGRHVVQADGPQVPTSCVPTLARALLQA